MSPATYTFRNEWTLPGRPVELYDVLEATLAGDLVGHSRWLVEPEGSRTRLRYHQHVSTPSTLMRSASRVARPLLKANHAWMMRGALRGLAGRTAR